MKNILIIGPGRLGGQVAFHALRTGEVKKVFLAGRDYSKTQGIATDLKEAFPEREIIPLSGYEVLEPVELTFFTFSSLKWSPSIGVNDRVIEAKANVKVIDQLATSVNAELLGTIIVVSNPVDILTWHAAITLKKESILGFGISLDERRMGAAVERLLGIKCSRLPCIGEHGSHVVPLLSHVIGKDQLSSEIYDQVRKEAFHHTELIVKRVSIPFYGPLYELHRALDILLLRKSGTLTFSKYVEEPILGVEGVALGVPIVIKEGVPRGAGHFSATPLEASLFTEAARAVSSQKQAIVC